MRELCQINRNSRSFFLNLPFLKVRFEGGLEVNSHCSETCSFEVEVEIHVILVRCLCGQFCVGFCFCLALHFRMLLHLSEVGLRGNNSFFFFPHLTFGLSLGLNFLFLCLLLHYNLLWRLCDLVGISHHWHSSVHRNMLSAARNDLEAAFALFNLNWCLNDIDCYGVRRNEKVAWF